jgi:hypothetical protein
MPVSASQRTATAKWIASRQGTTVAETHPALTKVKN